MEILDSNVSFYKIRCHRARDSSEYIIHKRSPKLYLGIDDASQNKPFPEDFDDFSEEAQVTYEIGRLLYYEFIKK